MASNLFKQENPDGNKDKGSKLPPPHKDSRGSFEKSAALAARDPTLTRAIDSLAAACRGRAQHRQNGTYVGVIPTNTRQDFDIDDSTKTEKNSDMGANNDIDDIEGWDFLCTTENPPECHPSVQVREARAYFEEWIRDDKTQSWLDNVHDLWPKHVPGCKQGLARVFERMVGSGAHCVVPSPVHSGKSTEDYLTCCKEMAFKARCLASEKASEEMAKWALYEIPTSATFRTIATTYEREYQGE